MKKTTLDLSAGVLYSALAASMFPVSSFAQVGSAGADELIVKAQRRDESIQDVPITVAAISGEGLKKRQIFNPLQMALSVPNLEVKGVYGATVPQIFIRGLGLNDFSEFTSGTVGVTVDEVYINSSLGQMLNFHDLDRVEVLKGPQGTLYGRNTTGGLLSVYSNRPGFEFDPQLSVSYGNYNTVNVEAASSVPLIDDVLAARVSISYNSNKGFKENLLYGTRENDVDSLAGRFQILFTPTPKLEIHAKVDAVRSRGSGVIGESLGIVDEMGDPCTADQIRARGICANPFTGYVDTADAYTGNWNIEDNPEDVDTITVRLGVSYDLEWASLDSITAYSKAERFTILDTDSSPFRIYDFVPGNTTEASQWSQELRLTSASDGPFSWILGAYYLTEDLYDLNGVESDAYLSDFIPGLGAGPEIEEFYTYYNLRTAQQDTESYAIFGHFNYEITDRLSATFGIRQTWDEKDLYLAGTYGPVNLGGPATTIPPQTCCLVGDPDSLVLTDYGFPTTGPVLIPSQPLMDDASFSKPNWRFSLDYDFGDVLLFASAARGTRSPSFNVGALFYTEYSKTNTESIDMFELGVKSNISSFAKLNLTGFYYEGDLQEKTVSNVGGAPAELLASVDVEGYGLEGELYVTPVEGLELASSFGLLETEYKSFPGKPDQIGNRLTSAPKFSTSFSFNYEVPVSDSLVLSFFGEANYKSDTFLSSDNNQVQFQEGFALYNASVSLGQAEQGVSLSLWAKNLADKLYYVEIYNVDVFGYYLGIVGEPRTYGATLRYDF